MALDALVNKMGKSINNHFLEKNEYFCRIINMYPTHRHSWCASIDNLKTDLLQHVDPFREFAREDQKYRCTSSHNFSYSAYRSLYVSWRSWSGSITSLIAICFFISRKPASFPIPTSAHQAAPRPSFAVSWEERSFFRKCRREFAARPGNGRGHH